MDRKQILLVLLVLVLFGCTTKEQSFESTPPSRPTLLVAANTQQPENTKEILSRTPTDVPPTVIPKTSSTVTPTTNSFTPKDINCYNLADWKSKPVSVKGVIVLSGYYYHSFSFLYDLEHDRKISIPQNKDEMLQGFSVSPNHEWLAYENKNLKRNESKLIIMTSDGQEHKTLVWDPSWRQIAEWLDNENLLISRNQGPEEIDSMIIFNPFTQKQQEIQPNFPGIWPVWIESWFNWGGFFKSGTIYSSDLSRVIFPYRNKEEAGIILWDLVNQQKISSLSGGFGNYPKWRPDGEGFAVDLSVRYKANAQVEEEFIYINRLGQTEQLTHLTETGGEVSIGSFNWSNDGKKIAFLLSQTKIPDYPDIYPNSPVKKSNRLAILDLNTRSIIDSCIPGDDSTAAPVWSPDGQYIVMEDFYETGFPQTGRVFLVDILSGIVAVITENATPIGWMQSLQ